MQAISANNLPELEDSVATQQDLSTRLSRRASQLREPAAAPSRPAYDSIPSDLMLEISAAAAELQQLNLRYAFLLQHASRSVALMASLFNSYKGQLKEVPGARLKMQTWSCQV